MFIILKKIEKFFNLQRSTAVIFILAAKTREDTRKNTKSMGAWVHGLRRRR
jgi:hypothetical protein